MEEVQKKSQYILWILALIIVFFVVTIAGSKIFYGLIVPQVQAISQFGIFVVLGFSFVAGLAAFFAPCPFAVFPAYIAYYLNSESETHADTVNKNRVAHAIKIGLIVSFGIFSFYAALGIIFASFGTALASYTNILKLAIIPVFFILGFILLSGKSIGTQKLDAMANAISQKAHQGKHFTNMYLYGIVYGIAAAACHLPILLALSLYPIIAGNFFHGFFTFIAYALGASVLLIVFTILASRGKKFLIQNLGLYGERIKKVGGAVLILTGIYLISFYLLFGM